MGVGGGDYEKTGAFVASAKRRSLHVLVEVTAVFLYPGDGDNSYNQDAQGYSMMRRKCLLGMIILHKIPKV